MTKQLKNRLLGLCAVICIFIFGCSKNNTDNKVENLKQTDPRVLVVKNLTSVLTNPDYKAENGVLINTTVKRDKTEKGAKGSIGIADGAPSRYSPVLKEYQRDITVGMIVDDSVYYQSNMDQSKIDDYSESLDWAINNWNTLVPVSNISFVRSNNPATAQIKVKLMKLDPVANYWGGMAIIPFDGKPGFEIIINTSFIHNFGDNRYKVSLISHELGHTLGFMHTELPEGWITFSPQGTPISYEIYTVRALSNTQPSTVYNNFNPDPTSIMYGPQYGPWLQNTFTNSYGYYGPATKGFSEQDRGIIEHIYPYIPVTYELPSAPGTLPSNQFTIDWVPVGGTLTWKLLKVENGVESLMPVGDEYPTLEPVAGLNNVVTIKRGPSQVGTMEVRVLPKVMKLGYEVNTYWEHIFKQGFLKTI